MLRFNPLKEKKHGNLSQPLIWGLAFLAMTTISFAQAYASFTPLGTHKKWLALNYYVKGWNGHYISDIQNDDFFLAKNGRVDPESELIAFKKLMSDYKNKNLHADTLCQFPARMTFLQQEDPEFKSFIRPVCKAYEEANHPDQISSVSVVFASGYFDNPSSYYGHTMLKFNYGSYLYDQANIDASLNYGANNTDEPLNPMYVLRGLFGGYDGSYKRNNELINSYQYTNVQVRDLWEYELNLTPEQQRFVVEHSWESARAQFKYYFFNDNCAHRMALLIEQATDTKISHSSGFWLIPSQIIRQLKGKKHNLLKAKHYIPSLKTQFSQQYSLLSDVQKNAFVTYIRMSVEEQQQAIQKIDTHILGLLLDYYTLELAKLAEKPDKKEKIKQAHQHRAILLSRIYALPADDVSIASASPKQHRSLIDARPPSAIYLESGFKDSSAVSQFTYRAANHDLLDTPIDGQEISRFLMGGFQLEQNEHQDIKLNKVTLLDIMNLNSNPLPMSVTKEYSWGLRIDYAPRDEFCHDCKSVGIESRIGSSSRITQDLLLYGLTGARVHTLEQDIDSYANMTATIGAINTINDKLALHLQSTYRLDLFNHEDDLTETIETRYKLTDRLDLRVSVATNNSETKTLAGIGWFFD